MAIDEFMTDVEVANRLRISASTVRTWRRLKKGPPYHRLGRTVRYRRADLNAWIDAQREESASEVQDAA